MPTPETKESQSIQDAIGSKGNISEVMKDAPLITMTDEEAITYPDGQQPEQKTGEKTTTTTETSQKTSSNGQQATTGEGKEGEGQSTDVETIRIGDVEMTEEEWLEASKDRSNRTTWMGNLTKYSQIQKYIGNDDEKLNQLVLYATGRKELPDDFLETIEIPEKIELPDEDGILQEFETKNLPKNVVEAIKWQAVKEMLPEAASLRDENKTLKQQVEEAQQQDSASGETYMRDFIDAVPDIQITQEDGQSLADALNERMNLPDHPEHDHAVKVLAVMNTVRDMKVTAPKAFSILFGKTVDESRIKNQIKQQQQESVTHGKAGTAVQAPVSDEDNFIEGMKDQKTAKINQLLG